MEGKLTYWKTLPEEETEEVFRVMRDTNDMFIVVNYGKKQLQNGIPSKSEQISTLFEQVRRTFVPLEN